MDVFRLIGSIFINNSDANNQIDETAENARGLAGTIGSAMETAGQKITSLGKTLMPISMATGAFLTKSVKDASDFTDGMAKMSTLFDTTQTSVSNLSKEFLDLSNKTGVGATELAEAGYQALSAGQSVEDVTGFVETAANLARAGFTSTTTAVDVLSTAINAYGGSCGSAEEVANKLVRTQNLGKTTVDELASTMGKIIPTASSMNVDINNLTAGYASLTKQGIATAEATTYMNSMMNELGDSGTDLGGIIKEKTGKSFQECMNSGMSLADVLKITKDYADESGIAYNELWGSAEAGKAGLAILNGGVEEFNGTVETMAGNVDDVGDALEKLETPSVKVQKAMNRVKNSGIQLGQTILVALTPTLDKVCGVVEKVTDWFSNLDNKTKTMIATVLGIITALAPALMIGGTIISGVGKVVGIVGKLSSVLSVIPTVLGAIFSPVGLIIAAIGALIAVFVHLYKTNEDFRNQVNTAWGQIKEKLTAVIEALKVLFEAFKERMGQLWDAIKGKVSNVVTGIGNLISSFITTVQNLWSMFGDQIINVLSNAFNFCQTVVQVALDVIKGIIDVVTAIINGDWSGAWEAIKSTLSTVWEGIKSLVNAGIEFVKSIIQLGLDVLSAAWSNIWEAIKTTLSNVWENIKTTVSNALENVKTTVTNAWENVKTTISNAIENVKTTISNGLEKAKSTVTTILDNIKQKFVDIWEGAKSTVSGAIETIKSIMSFDWKLPDLKLPHISISGDFSLMPPSVPSFGIEWYAKAVKEPMMFTKPTLFDMNPFTGIAKGAGEAGDEIIYGRQNLMNDIRSASGNTDLVEAFNDWMNRMFNLFLQYFPQFGNMQVVMDGGALVGQIVPEVDKQLGIRSGHKGRGN